MAPYINPKTGRDFFVGEDGAEYKYGTQQASDFLLKGGIARRDAVAPTPAPAVPVRTPSLLDRAKEEALVTEETQRKTRMEADLYASQMRQARIDAINKTFAPRLDRAKETGLANQSRVDALNFNPGIIGSGFDTANKAEQGKLDEKALQALEDEQAVMINNAFEYADQLAVNRAKELTEERSARSASNVALLTEKAETAKKALASFGQAGVTLEDIKKADPKTYEALRDIAGLTDFEMVTQLNMANPKMNAQVQFQDGVVYQYYTDPKTGKVNITTTKAEGVPANYKPQFAPDGTLIFMPDSFDPNRPINEQVISGGNFAKPEAPKSEQNFINLSATQKLRLGTVGFDPKAIKGLEQFLQTNSIDDAINMMESGGQPLTPAQKAQIKAALTGQDGAA